jgi:hypothetical protein
VKGTASREELRFLGPDGVWGSRKSSRDKNVVRQAAQGVCDYLESLRATS